jgi:hypothetical protein
VGLHAAAFLTAMCKLPLLKDKECGHHDKEEPHRLVPLDVLLEVENREKGKYHQSNDLLNGLELRGIEDVAAVAVGGDLKAVFKERNSPAYDCYFPEGDVLVFEVTVPRKRHEDVGDQQENDGQHVVSLSDSQIGRRFKRGAADAADDGGAVAADQRVRDFTRAVGAIE